jgi:two-component system, NarL family, nitrate/nitrite response regulator NarL
LLSGYDDLPRAVLNMPTMLARLAYASLNNMANQIRIVLVDHQKVVTAGLCMLLESHPGIEVVGEAANREQALALTSKEQPHIVLLGVDLGHENGLHFLQELFSAAPETKVILLTRITDPEVHRQAVRLGAMGVVTKEQGPEVLIKAIDRVHSGEVWLEPSLIAGVLSDLSGRRGVAQADHEADRAALLTEREREVIMVICEGLSNKEIACRLTISEATVGQHLRSIYAKLGLQSRLELVIYAYRSHLAEPSR